jgi:hypothetical protein
VRFAHEATGGMLTTDPRRPSDTRGEGGPPGRTSPPCVDASEAARRRPRLGAHDLATSRCRYPWFARTWWGVATTPGTGQIGASEQTPRSCRARRRVRSDMGPSWPSGERDPDRLSPATTRGGGLAACLAACLSRNPRAGSREGHQWCNRSWPDRADRMDPLAKSTAGVDDATTRVRHAGPSGFSRDRVHKRGGHQPLRARPRSRHLRPIRTLSQDRAAEGSRRSSTPDPVDGVSASGRRCQNKGRLAGTPSRRGNSSGHGRSSTNDR